MWPPLLALLVTLAGPAAVAAAAPTLTVYAASDLTFALREIVPLFERATGSRVTLVLGSTGTLARQIEHGAPADVFFAAEAAVAEDLGARGVTIRETQSLYGRGRIVLATSRRAGLALAELRDLARPEVRRIAIANPAHAPYGRAAREALETLGLWERLRPRLVYGANIRHALQFLQTGAAEAGIVALALAGVAEVSYVVIDSRLHRPLDQVAAVVRRSARPALGQGFIRFVNGPEGRPIMKRHGFVLPGEL